MSDIPRIMLKQKISLLAFGIIIALIILEVALRLFGNFYLYGQAQRNKIALEQWGKFRILCLGESTTALGGPDSYPRQLGRLLRQRLPGKGIRIVNKAIPGITTITILDNLQHYLDEYGPRMVIVMMGINAQEQLLFPEISDKSLLRWGKDKIKYTRIYKLMRFCKTVMQEKEILRNIYLQRAKFYIETDDDERTEEAFRKAIKTMPHDPDAYLEFARYFQEIKDDLNQAEEQFMRALIVSPTAYDEYLDFGLYCQKQGKYLQAERVFKNIITLSSVRPQAHTQLGLLYILEERLEEAERVLEENYENFSRDYEVILALATLYQVRGNLASAEELFLKAVDINPEPEAYIYLNQCYNLQGKYEEAEERLKRAFARYPRNIELHIELSRCYTAQKDFSRAEEVLKKASKMDPMEDEIFVELAWLYHAQNNEVSAEECLRHVLNIDPGNESLLDELTKYYDKRNKSLENDEIIQGFVQAYKSTDNYPASTKRRYRKLRDIVLARGITLVCVQYPRRRLQPLKDILGSKKLIIFVDNEKIFNEAVAKGRYEDYFTDRFAGDFGHCTEKGNRLLAENIAEALLREYFHK
ncbi:MAG: hypothetical protein A2166_00050 [Omnitrophica WOR_2 bacterium RBG_13_41_10]|nr:MAG: hypothetical protein A2166_00050 [Omnitrophica WOR_2 bacterium RBG_13_41_10]